MPTLKDPIDTVFLIVITMLFTVFGMIVGIALGIVISGPVLAIIGIFIKEIDGFAVMAVGFWMGIFGAFVGLGLSLRHWIKRKRFP